MKTVLFMTRMVLFTLLMKILNPVQDQLILCRHTGGKFFQIYSKSERFCRWFINVCMFHYKQGASKTPADGCWLKNFSGLLKQCITSVELERCIGISAKTQSLPCCQRFCQILLSVLNCFWGSSFRSFAREEIPKKTCMLE